MDNENKWNSIKGLRGKQGQSGYAPIGMDTERSSDTSQVNSPTPAGPAHFDASDPLDSKKMNLPL